MPPAVKLHMSKAQSHKRLHFSKNFHSFSWPLPHLYLSHPRSSLPSKTWKALSSLVRPFLLHLRFELESWPCPSRWLKRTICSRGERTCHRDDVWLESRSQSLRQNRLESDRGRADIRRDFFHAILRFDIVTVD